LGRITKLQNDIGALQAVLAKKNLELAEARRKALSDAAEIGALRAEVETLKNPPDQAAA